LSYDEGKPCAQTLFFDYRHQHDLSIKTARIFNTCGPRTHPDNGRVVSNFIVQALLNRDVAIFGDGGQSRASCDVDDLVRGIVDLTGTPTDIRGPIIRAIAMSSHSSNWPPQ
jgi:UDP-glucuronate decarboxylase